MTKKLICLIEILCLIGVYAAPAASAREIPSTSFDYPIYKDWREYQKPYAKKSARLAIKEKTKALSSKTSLAPLAYASPSPKASASPTSSLSDKTKLISHQNPKDTTYFFNRFSYFSLINNSRLYRLGWDIYGPIYPGYGLPLNPSRYLDGPPEGGGGPILQGPTPPSFSPNDPLYPRQWEMTALNMSTVWPISKGRGITVAVIDTGIQINHPDLINSLWVNSDEIPGDGIDNDHNGFIDDINGWNFYYQSGDLTPYVGVTLDYNHGTEMAGIIAAQQNNNEGMTGIAPESKIMMLMDGGPDEGFYDSQTVLPRAIQAIYYAVDNGARVVNMSFGLMIQAADGPAFMALQDAILYGISKGVVFVSSSGNLSMTDFNILVDRIPNIFFECLSIGALDPPGDLTAPFSNIGPQLDLVAPGTQITSTITFTDPADSKYMERNVSGTSASTAIVSGVVALMLSQDPTLTYNDIYRRLRFSASDRGATGWDPEYGFGLVNPYRALTEDYYESGQLKTKWFSDGAIETYYYITGALREHYDPISNKTTEYNQDGSIKEIRQGLVLLNKAPEIIPPHEPGKFNDYDPQGNYLGYTEYYLSGYIRSHFNAQTGQLDLYYDNRYYLDRGFTTPPRKSMTFFNNGNQIQYTEYWDNGNVKFADYYNSLAMYYGQMVGVGDKFYYENGTLRLEREADKTDTIIEYHPNGLLNKISWDSTYTYGEGDNHEIIYDSQRRILSITTPWGDKKEYDQNQKLLKFTSGTKKDIYEYYPDGTTIRKITYLEGFIEDYNPQGQLIQKTEALGWTSIYYPSGNLQKRTNTSLKIQITYKDENLNNTHIGRRDIITYESSTENAGYLYHTITYRYSTGSNSYLKSVEHKIVPQTPSTLYPTKTSYTYYSSTGALTGYKTFDGVTVRYYASGRVKMVTYNAGLEYQYLDEDFYTTDYPGFWHGRLEYVKNYSQATGGYSLITAYFPGTDKIKTEELRNVKTQELLSTTEYYDNGIYPKTIRVVASSQAPSDPNQDTPGLYEYYFSCNLKSFLEEGSNILLEYFDENIDIYDQNPRLGKGRLSQESNLDTHIKTIHVYEGQSIQEAVNKANAGDTVLIHQGTYHEFITLKDGVNLKGDVGQGSALILPPVITGDNTPSRDVLIALGNNKIENIKFTGGGAYEGVSYGALRIMGNGVIVQNNLFIDNKDCAVLFGGNVSGTIQNNLFVGNRIAVQLSQGQSLVQYNTFDRNDVAINILFGGACEIRNNIITESSYQSIIEYAWHLVPHQGYALVHDNILFNNTERGGFSSSNLPPSIERWLENNMNINPEYTDPQNGNYTLLPTSPALGVGYGQMYQQRPGVALHVTANPTPLNELDSLIAMRDQLASQKNNASRYPIREHERQDLVELS